MDFINKEKHSLIMLCDCGCGDGLKFEQNDEHYKSFNCYFYISSLSNGTADDKIGPIYRMKTLFKNLGAYIKKKPVYRTGIILKKNDVLSIIDYLKKEKERACSTEMANIIPNEETEACQFSTTVADPHIGRISFSDKRPDLYVEINTFDFSDISEDIEVEFDVFDSTKYDYNKARSFIKHLLFELKPTRSFMSDIDFSRIGFIHFSEWVIDELSEKSVKNKPKKNEPSKKEN